LLDDLVTVAEMTRMHVYEFGITHFGAD